VPAAILQEADCKLHAMPFVFGNTAGSKKVEFKKGGKVYNSVYRLRFPFKSTRSIQSYNFQADLTCFDSPFNKHPGNDPEYS